MTRGFIRNIVIGCTYFLCLLCYCLVVCAIVTGCGLVVMLRGCGAVLGCRLVFAVFVLDLIMVVLSVLCSWNCGICVL